MSRLSFRGWRRGRPAQSLVGHPRSRDAGTAYGSPVCQVWPSVYDARQSGTSHEFAQSRRGRLRYRHHDVITTSSRAPAVTSSSTATVPGIVGSLLIEEGGHFHHSYCSEFYVSMLRFNWVLLHVAICCRRAGPVIFILLLILTF